jgi:threonine dehydrogenase-like Zn-dependent dehydrogenase
MTLVPLDALRALMKQEKYDDVLGHIAEIRAAGFHDASLAVIEATAIQLGEGDAHRLEDAKLALEAAVAAEPDHADAAAELGWYRYNLDDDASGARAAFDAALDALRAQVTSVLVGLVRSIREAESDDAAIAFLAQASQRVIDADALLEALKEDG